MPALAAPGRAAASAHAWSGSRTSTPCSAEIALGGSPRVPAATMRRNRPADRQRSDRAVRRRRRVGRILARRRQRAPPMSPCPISRARIPLGADSSVPRGSALAAAAAAGGSRLRTAHRAATRAVGVPIPPPVVGPTRFDPSGPALGCRAPRRRSGRLRRDGDPRRGRRATWSSPALWPAAAWCPCSTANGLRTTYEPVDPVGRRRRRWSAGQLIGRAGRPAIRPARRPCACTGERERAGSTSTR